MMMRRSRKKKVEEDNAASVVAEDSDELEEATSVITPEAEAFRREEIKASLISYGGYNLMSRLSDLVRLLMR